MAVVIESAGGLVWRLPRRARTPEVLLAHRRVQQDWVLPKGRVEQGETCLDCALREVAEETGYVCEADDELPCVVYTDRKGRTRSMRFWTMRIAGGVFVPNDEVDEVEWCSPGDALSRISGPHDLAILHAWLSSSHAA